MSRLTQRGFTLLELVIAMVVAAILAAIAIPSYQSYVERSRRQVAQSVLVDLLAQQQQFQLVRRAPALSFKDLIGVDRTTVCVDRHRRLAPCSEGEPIYVIALLLESGRFVGFEATATGVQAGDSRCARFRARADGEQQAFSAADEDTTADCWR